MHLLTQCTNCSHVELYILLQERDKNFVHMLDYTLFTLEYIRGPYSEPNIDEYGRTRRWPWQVWWQQPTAPPVAQVLPFCAHDWPRHWLMSDFFEMTLQHGFEGTDRHFHHIEKWWIRRKSSDAVIFVHNGSSFSSRALSFSMTWSSVKDKRERTLSAVLSDRKKTL